MRLLLRMPFSGRNANALYREKQHLYIGAAFLIAVPYFHPQQFQKPGKCPFRFQRTVFFPHMDTVPDRHKQHDQDQGNDQSQDHKQYYADYL